MNVLWLAAPHFLHPTSLVDGFAAVAEAVACVNLPQLLLDLADLLNLFTAPTLDVSPRNALAFTSAASSALVIVKNLSSSISS